MPIAAAPEGNRVGTFRCDTETGVRKFNTEGPVCAQRHYCIAPLDRISLDDVLELVDDQRYFVLHAPRQTGKTSMLVALQDLLNAEGHYRCLHVNIEDAQTAREDVAGGMRSILSAIGSTALRIVDDDFVESTWESTLKKRGANSALRETLVQWSLASPKPLVLLIDEIDSLMGDTLISVLRQLRSEYHRRPSEFPQSVVLCGVRDVRDYSIYSAREGTHVKGGSAFNIKAKSLRLGDFTESEVRSLLGQHTEETGQQFEEDALDRVWHLTRGQPYLVNALAQRACFKDPAGRDLCRPIGSEAIETAKEGLILDRVTHLDQLADKLQEERVRRVIEPLLAGREGAGEVSGEDLDYVVDLGLVRIDGGIEMANPIYREMVPRDLTSAQGELIPHWAEWHVRADGSPDLPKLLAAFQEYFREHGEHWPEGFSYKAVAPQLLLQAYLQRVVNRGGRLEREYGLGRGRTDLLMLWPDGKGESPDGTRKHVIELKVAREGRGPERQVREGLEQTAAYMDRCGAESGHLVVFDTRSGRSWEERLYRRDERVGDKAVTVWGA